MRMIGTQGEARRLGLVLAVMAAFATGDAGAQTPLPKPAAEPAATGEAASGPAETTATYGNWVLHCARSKPADGGAAAATSCEIVQTIQVEGQREPFAKLAFGYPALTERQLIATAVVPVNVALPGRIGLSGNGKAGAEEQGAQALAWSRCFSGACFARANAEPGLVDAARKEKAGALRFIDAQGQVVAIPLSWNGFAQALAALDASVSQAAGK